MNQLTAYFSFYLDSFQILNTRSAHDDTDYVSFTLQVKPAAGSTNTPVWPWANPQTKTMSMGNLNNGTYPVGLSFGPVPVAPDQVVVLNYFIVNSGHNPPSDVESAITSAGNTAATEAGTALGTAIGTVVFPGLGSAVGSALGALAGWLSGVIFGSLFADCDGPVAAEQGVFTYSDLLAKTTAGSAFTQSTTNPGSSSPSGCGSNSLYVVNWHLQQVRNVRSFQALNPDVNAVTPADVQQVLVLGYNNNLWLEHAPFGKVPPTRQQIDQAVLTFQGLAGENTGNIYVLGTDGNLWLEQPPFGKVPPARQHVDQDVQAFQALDSSNVFVLGRNGNLWFEHAPYPASGIPTNRQQVGSPTVLAFQALDSTSVLVLYSNRYLYLLTAPFTNNAGVLVDEDVLAFQGLTDGSGNICVLGTNGNLWLEEPPFGKPIPTRQLVDGNVQAFQVLFYGGILVLGDNGNLWLEQGSVQGPPPRQQVDADVWAFQGLPGTTELEPVVLVLGDNGNLWLEHGPYGKVPPGRQQVDATVD